ncbi:MAG: type IV pilus secretin PilQ, partial [Pseudobdellovibrionaceae bacterium]
KLQRPFNTKDFQGSIGQIDAFESSENSARIVVQLRPGATEPMVQREGSSLLLISSNYGGPRNDYSDKNEFTLRTGVDSGPAVLGASGANDQTVGEAQLLEGTSSLRDFLSNNTQFYGKKITLETSTMQVKDALRFIMEDIGVNMVISDKVDGPLSLKLRQVPWDQALSLILKVKGLGFIRQGSVLRIMTMDELKAEEEAAVSSDRTQKALEPLQVKMFRVSYAQAASIADRLKQFSTERRGKIEADVPTNAVVVTDIPEVLERMEKILKTLDTQPPQVLIEGKIVEASESFSRTMGVSWSMSGQPVNIANGKQGPVTLTPSLNTLPGSGDASGTLNLGINVGVLDIFGDLAASLALNESADQVKVLASPRIVTVTNKEAKISLDNAETYIITTPTAGGAPFNAPQTVRAPTSLAVTPQVTADSSVVMKVSLNRVTLKGNPPAAQERTADTTVIVRNGQTMVLGGIFQNSENVSENRVPGLGNIPVIGWLFKQKTRSDNKTELLLFLTPKILNQSDTEKSITL